MLESARVRALSLWTAVAILIGSAVPAAAQSVADLFLKVSPSAVVVRARGRDVSSAGGPAHFNEIGSGVLISADGRLMIAAHVVQAMDEITVEFIGGETITAHIAASEPAADLSMLTIDRVPAGATVAPMADSDTVKIGDQVVVIGAPYGLGRSMTVGWISARWAPNTVYKSMPLAEFFQTDAVINTGNSGGPMSNMAGEIVALVSHMISKSGGSEGLGFAVTINTAKKVLVEERSFWSGLDGRLLSDELADLLNLPPKTLGYLVNTVAKGSPAEAVGLRGGTKVAVIDGERIVVGGDIILTVQGIPAGGLAEYEGIRDTLARLPSGSPMTVTVLRAGQVIELAGRKP
jgi:S1-C subfamily serine protease